jgi:hypothetical protein
MAEQLRNQVEPSPPPSSGVPGEGVIQTCPQCGCRDLFIRKDFPQKLGLGLVILAGISFLILAANPSTFYIGAWILVAAAAVDAVIYLFVGKVTVCYKCQSEFRGRLLNPKHKAF